MKNNILIYFFITFIFLIFFENKVNSEELQINASEIQSLEKGNKVIAYNGVEIIDPKGIVIQADNADYDKIKSNLKVIFCWIFETESKVILDFISIEVNFLKVLFFL